MTKDIPRALATKIDLLLTLIEQGKIQPDPFHLLTAAATLREHGEPARAKRCEDVARRLLPNLSRNLA